MFIPFIKMIIQKSTPTKAQPESIPNPLLVQTFSPSNLLIVQNFLSSLQSFNNMQNLQNLNDFSKSIMTNLSHESKEKQKQEQDEMLKKYESNSSPTVIDLDTDGTNMSAPEVKVESEDNVSQLVDNILVPSKEKINKIKTSFSTVGRQGKSAFKMHEVVSESKPRHNNTPGPVDHSTRSDVRAKTYLRTLYKVLMEFSKVKLKGKSEANKVITAWLEYVKEHYGQLWTNREILLQIMGPILESKFTGKFESKVNSWTVLSEVDKQYLIAQFKEYDEMYTQMSRSCCRSYLRKHPIFKAAKKLIMDNKIYYREFWTRIMKTRKKQIVDHTTYSKIILKDIEELII